MWKAIILAVSLITVNAKSTVDEFVGDWTAVAVCPGFIYIQGMCYKTSFFKKPEKCTCGDAKFTELIETIQHITDIVNLKEVKITFPALVVQNASEVNSALNVTCSCGEQNFHERVALRSLNDNFFVSYRPQTMTKKDPNGAIIYAKQLPTFEQLRNFLNSVEDLSNRDGEFLCTSEYLQAYETKKKQEKEKMDKETQVNSIVTL